MNRKAIENTAFCYWSDDDDCYVVESSKLLSTAGIGETEREAWKCFNQLLDKIEPDLLAGKVVGYTKRGRPAKKGVHIHAQVRKSTKELIDQLAEDLGISQTDAIDHLAFYFERTRSQNKPNLGRKRTVSVAESEATYRSTTKRPKGAKKRSR